MATSSAPSAATFLAPRSSRLLAQCLDGFVAAVPLVGALVLAALDNRIGVALVMAALLFSLAYYLFADALEGGRSWGKRVLGMAVVDASTGRPCTLWQSFLRNALLAVLGPIDWVFIFGARHQRLGDLAAHTVVVRTA